MQALRIIFAILFLYVGAAGSDAAQAQNSAAPTPVDGFQVIHTYPHDKNAFTQGLIYLDGYLYESTGLNGRSSLRKVELNTGKVVQELDLDKQYFAEGMTNWGPDLVQLTYQTNVGFVYDRKTFKQTRKFYYDGEGWGLTSDGARLIMSDGTPELRFFDPVTLKEAGRLMVKDHGQPIFELNELEYIHGEIYANIWRTDRIARISPATGQVIAWIDLRGLLKPSDVDSPEAVLNGIAYDPAGDHLYVTGKLWPKLFEIKLLPPK